MAVSFSGQISRRAVAAVRKRLLIGQLEHLRVRRFGQARLAETQRRAPQSRHALDVTLALVIKHVDAFPPLDQQRPHLFMQPQVGLRMEMVGNISLGHCRITSGHDVILFVVSYAYAVRGFIFTIIERARQIFYVSLWVILFLLANKNKPFASNLRKTYI
jgi:hypothetical protein